MTRFYFDVDDGRRRILDEVGMDLASPDDVPRESFNLLRGIVQDRLPEGRRVMTVDVRDARGVVVYRGEMTVDGKRFPA